MNVVVLRGRLSSEPVRRELASGSVVLSMEVSTTTVEGTLTVPAAWFDPPAATALAVGDEVLLRGVVKRRFFRAAGGTQSRTEVMVAEACRSADKRRGARLIAAAAESLARS